MTQYGGQDYVEYAVSWPSGGAWEIWESSSSTPGTGSLWGSGASGTSTTISKRKGTGGFFYYYLRYTSPLSDWRALDMNPLVFTSC